MSPEKNEVVLSFGIVAWEQVKNLINSNAYSCTPVFMYIQVV